MVKETTITIVEASDQPLYPNEDANETARQLIAARQKTASLLCSWFRRFNVSMDTVVTRSYNQQQLGTKRSVTLSATSERDLEVNILYHDGRHEQYSLNLDNHPDPIRITSVPERDKTPQDIMLHNTIAAILFEADQAEAIG